MTDALLLLGWKPVSIQAVLDLGLDKEILVLEEPTLCSPTRIEGARFIPARYQQSDEAIGVAIDLAEEYRIVAVVPLREYTTPAAQDVAEALGLPRIGHLASRCFRDKFVLRSTVAQAEPAHFSQPAFAQVSSSTDALAFFDQHGESIIKPSNRQSTVGVFRIRRRSEVARRFAESVNIDEPDRVASDRVLSWHHQIEEFINGQEYSTELFFRDGELVFSNATKKRTHDGVTPYEIGHTLPLALIASELSKRLVVAAQELAQICEVGSGTIHAEWMVRDGEIFLVECAGRPPGCFITDLISHSYGFKYFALLISVLARLEVPIPAPDLTKSPELVSAMRWFNPDPGIVTVICNQPRNSIKEGVQLLDYSLNAKVGDLFALTNNHTRVGYAIADGPIGTEVEEMLDQISFEAITTNSKEA